MGGLCHIVDKKAIFDYHSFFVAGFPIEFDLFEYDRKFGNDPDFMLVLAYLSWCSTRVECFADCTRVRGVP